MYVSYIPLGCRKTTTLVQEATTSILSASVVFIESFRCLDSILFLLVIHSNVVGRVCVFA